MFYGNGLTAVYARLYSVSRARCKLFNYGLVIFLTFSNISIAFSDAFTDAASAGQSAARDILNSVPTSSGNNPNFSYTDSGGLVQDIDTSFTLESTPNSSQSTQFQSLTGTYQNDQALNNTSDSYVNNNNTSQDFAVGVVQSANQRSHPDLTNDPIWITSDQTLSDLDTFASQFADCSLETTEVPVSRVGHIPDYRTCEITNTPPDTCRVEHDYGGSLFTLIESQTSAGAFASCGPGCVDLWVGKVGDNYWAGFCDVYEQETEVKVHFPDAIISATLEQAQWDDYIQIFVRGSQVYNGPNANFPPELYNGIDYTLPGSPPYPGTACELGTSWNVNPGIDLTSTFKSTPAHSILDFKTRVSVAGNGEGYSRIRIYYDVTKVITNDVWTPQNCADGYDFARNSPFCSSSSATCTRQLATGSYTNEFGLTISESDLLPSPISAVSNLCKRVEVTTDCHITSGPLDCYIDINGVQQCPTNNNPSKNTCSPLEADPTCAFYESNCLDGATDLATGKCLVIEDTYDCGYDVDITTSTFQEDYVCPGPIRCMGTECTHDTNESSDDFARLAATMEVIKYMAMDQDCDISVAGGGGPGTDCTIFSGQPGTCKKAVGGTVDCCQKPQGVSMSDYLQLVYAIYSVDQAVKSLDNPGAIAGSWLTLTDPLRQTYSTISNGASSLWTSATESIFGGGTAGNLAANASGNAAAETAVKNQVGSDMMATVADWVQSTFGDEVKQLLFEKSASGATQLGGQVGTVLSGVMAAYMYYQIAVIAIQIVYACEESEFELNAKRVLLSTHKVGSYCASKTPFGCIEKRESYCSFSSPLSRIMNEQLRPTIGVGWGSPQSPNCEGLSLNQIGQVDWNQVDLSEWEAILYDNNILPTVADTTLEGITGDGNFMNPYGDRDNVLERTQSRLNATNPDLVRETIRQNTW